jgi:hypothetical protein
MIHRPGLASVFTSVLAAAAMLALGAAPAAAQSANDAKCFIASNVFTHSTDPKVKQVAVEASYFYLGRLGGTVTQIEAALAAQGKVVTMKNAGAIMQGCAQVVAARTKQVQAVGQRLQAAMAK